MTTFFTSDHHFGHFNIIGYMNRPFAGIHEMHDALVANHNAVVGAKDTVYYLGDFSWADPAHILDRLTGAQKFLIIGNHDWEKTKWYHKSGKFGWIKDVELVKVEGVQIWLSHYPHRTWPHKGHGAWHLYGHAHGFMPDHDRSCDVGVDCWNYTPVSFEQLKARIGDRPYAKED